MTKSSNEKAAPTPIAAKAPAKTTKKDQLLAMLRAEGGASLEEMVSATNWLPHTSRAMLTGLRKKGHAIEKSKIDSVTRYSIQSGPTS